MTSVSLYELAHARSGDKGNRLNIAVICREAHDYQPLSKLLTTEFVADVFRERRPSNVARYDLPRLGAFNFVLDDVLEGGVNASLGLDGHGKTLSFLLLSARIAWPAVSPAASHGSPIPSNGASR